MFAVSAAGTTVTANLSGEGESSIERVTAVVIGAGQAGLAASYFLSERSIDHVVLERGEVANSWRRERWDSFRLLTPNWLTRLPGQRYQGADPDGYMAAEEVADFIEGFAKTARAPVRTGVTVTSVRPAVGGGYQVLTRKSDMLAPESGSPRGDGVSPRKVLRSDPEGVVPPGDGSQGEFRCQAVVLAAGACNLPSVPPLARGVPSAVRQVTVGCPDRRDSSGLGTQSRPAAGQDPVSAYRSPDNLPEGGVLVVGASATGVQLAAEIARSGRPVTLSVGEHVRMPRVYRGRDVLWWMDAAGVWDQRHDEIEDLDRARGLPSPQLAGTPERATLGLNTLTDLGVQLVGRWAAVRDGRALFSGGLRNVFSLADLKLERLLDTFDEWAHASGRDGELPRPERFEPTRVPETKRLQLDLGGGEIAAIVWATGFRPDYRWLDVPVLDDKGRLRHEGGVTPSPGLYALGLPVLRRRRSTFICGIQDDAREVIANLARGLLLSVFFRGVDELLGHRAHGDVAGLDGVVRAGFGGGGIDLYVGRQFGF
ncbi:MAG TPA: NAD(P)-binding domain-containing protein [Trebonia sp.]